MAVLFNAGEYDLEDEVKLKGFSYLDQKLSIMDPSPFTETGKNYFLYTHFYAAQVYKQRGQMYFEKYFSKIKNALIPMLKVIVLEEKPVPITDGVSEAYGLAMMLLILETSLDYLPIFTD